MALCVREELALTLNRLYVQENMTSILMWTPIYSWYEWLWFSGKGLVRSFKL